jgi:hypothetical protein
MSFETQKNKFFKIWNDTTENTFKISRLSSTNALILDRVDNLNQKNTVIKNRTVLNSEWIQPNLLTDSNDEVIQMEYPAFSIEINGIHKSLIPYFSSKILLRLGNGNAEEFEYEPINITTNEFVEIKTILAGFRRNIVYHACASFGIPENAQVKFLVTLFNPRTYQVT